MDVVLYVGSTNAIFATVLAGVAALAGWSGRRPAMAHALWLLVLLKLITPPLYPVSFQWPEEVAAETVAVPIPGTQSQPSPVAVVERDAPTSLALADPDEDVAVPYTDVLAPESTKTTATSGPTSLSVSWTEVVELVWMAGAAIWFALAIIRLVRFRRLLRHGRTADRALQVRIDELAHLLELAKSPVVWLVPGCVSPMLWALVGRARLILPQALLSRLTEDQRDALLVHELAHLRRRDHWVRVLEFVTSGLFWWHPVVWWARRAIRDAEEQCCDAWVVWAFPAAARGYALALVETVDFLSEARTALPPAASGIGQVQDLRRRLTMIMRGSTRRALGWAGVLAVLAAAIFLLPMLPTMAQTPPPRDRSSPDEDLRRAEDELKRAAARLEEARRAAAERKEKEAAEKVGASRLNRAESNAACMRCHADPNAAKGPRQSEEFKSLHDGVIKLSHDVEHQREALKAAEMKLKAAFERLNEMSPDVRGDPRSRPEKPAEVGRPDFVPSERPGTGPPKRDPEVEKRLEEKRRGEQDLLGLNKQTQERLNDLARQVEVLTKELQKLRKEMEDRPPRSPSELGRPPRDPGRERKP